MFDHRINNREQFSHTSDQHHLWFFTGAAESGVKGTYNRVMSACDQGRHVETSPRGRSTSPDGAATFKLATVPVERGDSDQSRDLFAIELSQLGQLGKQGTANDGTNPGDTSKQVFVLLPDRALTNTLVQIFISAIQFRFQPPNVSVYSFVHALGSSTRPISFRHQHLDDLAAPGAERFKLLAGLIRQRAHRRTYGFSKAGQAPKRQSDPSWPTAPWLWRSL